MIVINEKSRGVVELLDRISKAVGENDDNYFTPLDDRHSAAFLKGSSTLFIGFERAEEAASGPSGELFAHELHKTLGWSTLSLIAESETWFRTQAMYEFFDSLIDADWFEDFDQVIFYGSGTAGYAACAFSVAAPGSTVLAFSPQATLDPTYAAWDTRFSASRRIDFSSRFGYAPRMCEAAREVHVFFDPRVILDASHAAQFNQSHMHLHRLRHYGENPAALMMQSGEMLELFQALANGPLTTSVIANVVRARRSNISYIRRLLAQSTADERPYLSALVCRYVTTKWSHAPRFAKRLDQLTEELAKEGRSLPPQLSQS